MKIRRHVFAKLRTAHPELEGRDGHAWFHPEPGGYEDWSLQHRWRALGGKVWCWPHTRLGHVGPYRFESTLTMELVPPGTTETKE